MTAYLQLLQPDLIGRHVIFNTDKMEGQARALVAIEGTKRGPAARMQHKPSFHQPAGSEQVCLCFFTSLFAFSSWSSLNSC